MVWWPSDVLKSSRALGVTRIKVDPHEPDTVYTATLNGLYKTNDGGQSWVRIGESLSDQMLSDLILDPSHLACHVCEQSGRRLQK